MNPRQLLQNLPPYMGRKYVIKKNQNVSDIIAAMEEAHKKHREEYKKIAREFLGPNKKQTARNIWNFLKKNVPYKEESVNRQTIKSPAAIIVSGLYGIEKNDCKNYALFAGGILQGLNDLGYKIPYSFRFVSYNLFDKTPGHVFVVIDPGTKKEIWIDPVLPGFDQRKPYQYSKDKKMIYSISGIGATKKRKFKQVVLKFAASPARNAFLALVGLNFANLAKKLRAADTKAPGKLKNFWEGLGGRYQTLLNNIKKGEKKRRLLGDDSIGAEPVTLATLLASASAIIAKLGDFLKKIGIDPKELGDVAKQVLQQKAQQAILKQNQLSDIEQEKTEQMIQEIDETGQVQKRSPGTMQTGTDIKKILPLVAIAGVGILLLTRNK